MLDYLVSVARHGITSREALLRWSICWGTYSILGQPPNSVSLVEAKFNIFQDDNFEQQKDCIAVSVQKYLAARDVEAARRVVSRCYDDYDRISCRYWREKWLSTLTAPLEMLRRQGVRIRIRDGN